MTLQAFSPKGTVTTPVQIPIEESPIDKEPLLRMKSKENTDQKLDSGDNSPSRNIWLPQIQSVKVADG